MILNYFRKKKNQQTPQPNVDITTYSMYEDVINEYKWLARQYQHIANRAVDQLTLSPSCFCEETLPVNGNQCETCNIIEDYDRLTRYDK